MSEIQTFRQSLASVKQVLPLILFIIAMFLYFASRYSVALNVATSDCLNSQLFLIDKWDKRLNEGQLVAFTMRVETPFFETGNVWVKKAAAVGAQTITVTPESITTENSQYALAASYILNKLEQSPDQLQSQWQLEHDQLFMIGETLTSFDSRFWGPINRKDIVGRAYAIF